MLKIGKKEKKDSQIIKSVMKVGNSTLHMEVSESD